jgi:bacillaene synthase trans-acting acyltransferase
LGASLGEFTAAAVAEVLGVEDTLECLIKQAEALENYYEQSGMLAVLCDSSIYYNEPLLFKKAELAAINYHSHFVVSGDNESLEEIIGLLKERKILHQLLPVAFGLDKFLWNVVRGPIRFQNAMDEMNKRQELILLDVGPSGSLANFAKYTLAKDSKSLCYSIITPFHQDIKNLSAVVNHLQSRF